MTELPQGFSLNGLYCMPVDLPPSGRFVCLSELPGVALEAGRARLSLFGGEDAMALTLEAVWQPDEAARDAAQRAIASGHPDIGHPRLELATLEEVSATLVLHARDGSAQALGPRPASGFSSNRVAFHESINADQAEIVRQALRGESGRLTLRYDASLTLEETAQATISGDLAGSVKALTPEPDPDDGGFFGFFKSRSKPKATTPPPLPSLAACEAEVVAALASGRLVLTHNDTPNVPQALREELEAGLRGQVAAMLLDKLRQPGVTGGTVKLNTAKSCRRRWPVSRSLDVGEWLRQRGASAQDAIG